MAPEVIFGIGAFAVALLALFVYLSVREVRRGAAEGALAARAVSHVPVHLGPEGPMRILLATDGSRCSERAAQQVSRRPWPAGSRVEILTVVHTRLPMVPEPFLTGAAAHVTALEEDRQRAPARVQAAEAILAGGPLVVSTKVREGAPAEVIVDEARAWGAHLVVVGAHGYGALRRLALGSVSEAVARQAPCSVEIVRCPEAHLTAGG